MSNRPVVLVTGASRGLGEATALLLARGGADLVLAARSKQALAKVEEACTAAGSTVYSRPADVSDPQACENLVRESLERFGRLDALINNAGVIEPIGSATQCSAEEWAHNISVNLNGPFYLTRAALPALREAGGRVLNVGTGASTQPLPGWSAYCASKAGLRHLTAVLAAEEPGITFLSVTPGVVETTMQETIREQGPGRMPEQMVTYFQQLKQHGMLEPPEVPGRALAWLALRAPREWSGREVNYSDPEVAEPARALA